MYTFPALIRLAATVPTVGYEPTPMIPFSLWRLILTSEGRTEGSKVGIPMPKLTFIPFLTSLAALAAILVLSESFPTALLVVLGMKLIFFTSYSNIFLFISV